MKTELKIVVEEVGSILWIINGGSIMEQYSRHIRILGHGVKIFVYHSSVMMNKIHFIF